MYRFESELVNDFTKQLSTVNCLFLPLKIAHEFDYQSGRVDVVGASAEGDLFSFEAKLDRWRDAIYQAYRNTTFSHYSYVVLPERTAKKAAIFWHEFDMRGVGLCAISSDTVRIDIPAARQSPIMPWLTNKAIQYIYNDKSVFNNQELCPTKLLPLF